MAHPKRTLISGYEASRHEEQGMALTQLAEDTSVCIHTTRSTSSQVHQSTGPSSAIETTVPVESYTHPSDLQRSSEEAEHVPPNGGVEAYLKVLGGFCVFFVTLGLASTFGSYQAYYESDLLKFSSPSTISWIGTSQVFLLSFIGTFSGAFYDWGYVRLVLGVGLSLIVFGLMMLSLAQEYWQILLSQGICVGIGSGLVYVPAVSVVSNEFSTRRAVALGLAATGSAVGGIILPIMFRKLLPILGWGWANRVLAFLVLALGLTAFTLLTDLRRTPWKGLAVRFGQRQHTHAETSSQSRRASSTDLSNVRRRLRSIIPALTGRSYLFLCVGVFFVFLGYWIPLFYIVPFASVSLGASTSYASYLLSILNAGSFFGRTLPAYLGQIVGTALVLFVGALSLGVTVFAWLGIGNLPGISVWCFLVGFSSGIVVSIPNAVASRLSSPSNVGLRIGAMWTAGAFAELIGAPIAGALVKHNPEDQQDVSYKGGQVFGGMSILVGAAFLVVPAWSILKEDKVKAARMA